MTNPHKPIKKAHKPKEKMTKEEKQWAKNAAEKAVRLEQTQQGPA